MSNLSRNIEKARQAAGYTQAQVAETLGMSRPTYALIESGEKDITLSQLEILAAMFRTTEDELRGAPDGVSTLTDPQSSIDKYKQIILNALKFGADATDGKITKTKLAKLVYLADFTWYYNELRPMSGMSYRRLPRGPVPDVYFRAIDEMVNDGVIDVEQKGRAFMISMVEQGDAPSSKLSNKEREVIKEIGEAWQGKQTQEIVDFTHEQLPWQICRDGEVIPYGLITQEDPEKVYGPASELAKL
jgi:transcriptional regulator with XRE-family HTH domain